MGRSRLWIPALRLSEGIRAGRLDLQGGRLSGCARALALLAGSLLAIRAAADTPRYNFECDTPAGHYSYWNRSVSGDEIEISGKITVNELREDKKWSPGAHVYLRSEKEKSAAYGLRIYALLKVPDMLFLELRKPDGGEKIGLGPIPRTSDPIPFTLRLDSSGHLVGIIAGFEASTSLGSFKPDSMELSCTTGDYEFTDVTVKEKEPGPH